VAGPRCLRGRGTRATSRSRAWTASRLPARLAPPRAAAPPPETCRTTGAAARRAVDGLAWQGREKELILFSAVRSNRGGRVGFLGDWRRLNVMLTRARRGLIVVGSAATLRHDALWQLWFEWCERHGSIVDRKAWIETISMAVRAADSEEQRAGVKRLLELEAAPSEASAFESLMQQRLGASEEEARSWFRALCGGRGGWRGWRQELDAALRKEGGSSTWKVLRKTLMAAYREAHGGAAPEDSVLLSMAKQSVPSSYWASDGKAVRMQLPAKGTLPSQEGKNEKKRKGEAQVVAASGKKGAAAFVNKTAAKGEKQDSAGKSGNPLNAWAGKKKRLDSEDEEEEASDTLAARAGEGKRKVAKQKQEAAILSARSRNTLAHAKESFEALKREVKETKKKKEEKDNLRKLAIGTTEDRPTSALCPHDSTDGLCDAPKSALGVADQAFGPKKSKTERMKLTGGGAVGPAANHRSAKGSVGDFDIEEPGKAIAAAGQKRGLAEPYKARLEKAKQATRLGGNDSGELVETAKSGQQHNTEMPDGANLGDGKKKKKKKLLQRSHTPDAGDDEKTDGNALLLQTHTGSKAAAAVAAGPGMHPPAGGELKRKRKRSSLSDAISRRGDTAETPMDSAAPRAVHHAQDSSATATFAHCAQNVVPSEAGTGTLSKKKGKALRKAMALQARDGEALAESASGRDLEVDGGRGEPKRRKLETIEKPPLPTIQTVPAGGEGAKRTKNKKKKKSE